MLGEEPAKTPVDVLKTKDTKWVDEAPSSQLPLLHIDALWESGGHTRMRVHMCIGMAQRLLLLFRDVHSPHPHPVAQQACTLSFLAVTLGLLKNSVQTAWQRLSTIGYVGNLNIEVSYASLIYCELLTAVFHVCMLNFLSSELL